MDNRQTYLVYSEQVHDEGMLHAGESVDLSLDDEDRPPLRDSCLCHHLDLCVPPCTSRT